MKLIHLTAILLLTGTFSSFAQSADEAAIMKPINALFLGMKKGDSALVHSAFARQVMFVRVGKNKAGKPALRMDQLQGFLNAVGTPHTESWNELIWGTEIRIDGNFAQAWAKFGFHLGKKLDHCGVDAFQLFRDETGNWKIFGLEDTHQVEGCMVPAAVTAQLN